MFDILANITYYIKLFLGLGTIGLVILGIMVIAGFTTVSKIIEAVASVVTNIMPAVGIWLSNLSDFVIWYAKEFWGDAQMVAHNMSIVITMLIPLFLLGSCQGYNYGAKKSETAVIKKLRKDYTFVQKKKPSKQSSYLPKLKLPSLSGNNNFKIPAADPPRTIFDPPGLKPR